MDALPERKNLRWTRELLKRKNSPKGAQPFGVGGIHISSSPPFPDPSGTQSERSKDGHSMVSPFKNCCALWVRFKIQIWGEESTSKMKSG